MNGEKKIICDSALTQMVSKFQGNGLRATLLRGAGGSFFVNALGTGMGFGIQLVLARLLGAEQFGIFTYAFTWMSILVLFGKFGMDTASVRFVAEYNGRQDWGLLRGFFVRSGQTVLICSISVSLISALLVFALKSRMDNTLAAAFWIACLIIPVNALIMQKGASLRGLKHVVKSQASNVLMRPVFVGFGLAILYALGKRSFSATTVMWLYLIAFCCILGVLLSLLYRHRPPETITMNSEFETSHWIRVALPMLLITALYQIEGQVDIMVLGFFVEPAQIGIYGAVKKLTVLITFGLNAVNVIAAPLIAELYAKQKTADLQRMVKLAALGILLYTIPVSIFLMAAGSWVLAFFGPDFVVGSLALKILLVGQVINALSGSVGYIMIMTGRQRQAALIIAFATIFSIVLNLLLVPRFGIEGSALALTMAMIFWNGGMLWYVITRIGINPTIFSVWRY